MPSLPNPPLTFDEDGDLRFEVGPSKQSFRVYSRAVSRASPVLNRMLNGPWNTSKQRVTDGHSWVVQLPADDATALATIFYIIHGKFNKVKTNLSLRELFDVCVIVDKYDCVETTRPYAWQWCKAVYTEHTDSFDDRLLWVAWVLGHESMFKSTAQYIIRTAKADHGGSDDTSSSSANADFLPISHVLDEFEFINSLEIMGDLKAKRLDLIDELLKPLKTVAVQLQDRNRRSNIYCEATQQKNDLQPVTEAEKQKCQSFLLSTFIRATDAQGLYPIPKATQITSCVTDLRWSIMGLYFDEHQNAPEAHKHCGLRGRIMPLIAQISLDFEPPERFLKHVRAQALKTGMDKLGRPM